MMSLSHVLGSEAFNISPTEPLKVGRPPKVSTELAVSTDYEFR